MHAIGKQLVSSSCRREEVDKQPFSLGDKREGPCWDKITSFTGSVFKTIALHSFETGFGCGFVTYPCYAYTHNGYEDLPKNLMFSSFCLGIIFGFSTWISLNITREIAECFEKQNKKDE